jgi:hypothetical protein
LFRINFLNHRTFVLLSSIFFCGCSSKELVIQPTTETQYTLTVIVREGGIVTPDATGIYNEGSQLTLSAIPDEGYVFCRWLGTDNDSEGCLQRDLLGLGGARGKSRCIIKMNSNREVEAFFQKKLE